MLTRVTIYAYESLVQDSFVERDIVQEYVGGTTRDETVEMYTFMLGVPVYVAT